MRAVGAPQEADRPVEMIRKWSLSTAVACPIETSNLCASRIWRLGFLCLQTTPFTMKKNEHKVGQSLTPRKTTESALRTRLDARTHELAELAGRPPPFVTQRDYERAKEDVTGETDRDRQNAVLDGPATER